MSLEKVAEEIILQAKKEAEKITQDAKKEAEKITLIAKAGIEEKRACAEAETEGIIEAMAKKEFASAKLEEKRLILDAKKDAIEKAYSGLREKIAGLDKKTKEKIYARMLQSAKKEFEPGYVYARSEDIALAKKLAGTAKVAEENIFGGLIFESADKKMRIDMSFDDRLQSIKSDEIKAISKILFGEGA